MNAGPEVDRLVAIKVMGWKPHPDPRRCLDVVTDGGFRTCHPGAFGDVTFCPSTDIAHAWEVVEHMATKGMALTINGGNAGFLCFFYHRGEVLDGGVMTFPLVTDGHAEAATAPLAICLAALQAVGWKP